MPRAKIGRVTPVPAQPFFHFRRITLNPAVNRGVIDIHSAFSQHLLQLTVTDAVFAVPAYGPQNDVTLKMPAFEWVHVQLHQQKGMISLSPPTICNSATKDHPPVYNKKQSSNFNPSIFISTQALLEHVTATMHKNAQYMSKNEKIYLSPALKFHVQTFLGTTAQCRHERYEYNAALQICFGLSTAHFYLSKAKNFEETLQLSNNYNLQSESKVLSNLEKKEQQTSSYQRLSRESKTIYQTTVLDISVNGYRIKWSGEAPKNLRTGEYILVKETLHGQWRGGVIRWIKQSTEKSLELGLEILSQAMFPCAVHIQAERHTRNYHPALLLQTQNLEEIQNTLILPGSQIFREQQTIHLRLGTEEIKVYLLKAQLITQSFIQFQFELLNEQQQYLLDQFMLKKNNTVNSQDLWEALK
ncbi:P12 domain protein [Acinetobacter baumannii 1237893]|nr:P12 domain protein [Acinetobacter baumannii 1237893]